jgi:hypothetical protein
MQKIELRACCKAPDAPAAYFDDPMSAARASQGDIVGTIVVHDGVDPNLAMHESGHAIVACAIGVEVEFVKMSGAPYVALKGTGADDLRAQIIFLAGPAAQGTDIGRFGQVATSADVTAYDARVLAGVAGDCDKCVTIKAIRTRDPGASGEEVAASYRAAQRAANDLVGRPEIWAAIEALTALLIRRRNIFGYEVEEIARRYFVIGN